MAYKKHNWMKYGQQGEILDIKICDCTGRRIDSFKANTKKDSDEIARIINRSYGFFPSLSKKTHEQLKDEVEQEKEFLKKNMEW